MQAKGNWPKGLKQICEVPGRNEKSADFIEVIDKCALGDPKALLEFDVSRTLVHSNVKSLIDRLRQRA